MRTPNVIRVYYVCAEEIWLITAVITRISKGAASVHAILVFDTKLTSGHRRLTGRACESQPMRDNLEGNSSCTKVITFIEREFNNAVKLHWLYV